MIEVEGFKVVHMSESELDEGVKIVSGAMEQLLPTMGREPDRVVVANHAEHDDYCAPEGGILWLPI
jgi:hypothetical protein